MDNNNRITIKRVIQRCGCDKVLPLTIVYILYIALHGHLSPGGGFQGGILTVAAVLLVYLGHGYMNTKKAFLPNIAHPMEGVVLMIYIVLAYLGIRFGAAFCANFCFANSRIGDLFSSGTVFWMGELVALDVICGAVVLSIGVISVLFPLDIDNLEENNQEHEKIREELEKLSKDDNLEM